MEFGTFPLAHLGLRVSDLSRAKRFYIDTLGFGLLRESSEAVFMDAYGLLIALIGPAEQTDDTDRFDPFRVGLDHLALAIADVGDLDGLRRQLDDASVPNHGIEQDPSPALPTSASTTPMGSPGSCTPCQRDSDVGALQCLSADLPAAPAEAPLRLTCCAYPIRRRMRDVSANPREILRSIQPTDPVRLHHNQSRWIPPQRSGVVRL